MQLSKLHVVDDELEQRWQRELRLQITSELTQHDSEQVAAELTDYAGADISQPS